MSREPKTIFRVEFRGLHTYADAASDPCMWRARGPARHSLECARRAAERFRSEVNNSSQHSPLSDLEIRIREFGELACHAETEGDPAE